MQNQLGRSSMSMPGGGMGNFQQMLQQFMQKFMANFQQQFQQQFQQEFPQFGGGMDNGRGQVDPNMPRPNPNGPSKLDPNQFSSAKEYEAAWYAAHPGESEGPYGLGGMPGFFSQNPGVQEKWNANVPITTGMTGGTSQAQLDADRQWFKTPQYQAQIAEENAARQREQGYSPMPSPISGPGGGTWNSSSLGSDLRAPAYPQGTLTSWQNQQTQPTTTNLGGWQDSSSPQGTDPYATAKSMGVTSPILKTSDAVY